MKAINGLLSNLLVVVNGSDSSIAAAKYAVALGKTMGSAVTAAYVVDTATIRQLAMSRIFVDEESEEYERSLEDTGKRYLAYVEEIGRSKSVQVATRLLNGSIAGAVVKFAEELRADCILLGSSGTRDSEFRDVILEAYREIAKVAPCSVLYVRSDAAEAVFKTLR